MVTERLGKVATMAIVKGAMDATAIVVAKPVAMVRSMVMKHATTVTKSIRMRVRVPVRLRAAVTTSFGTDVKSVMMVMR